MEETLKEILRALYAQISKLKNYLAKPPSDRFFSTQS